MYGPVVLACIGCKQPSMPLPPASALKLLHPVPQAAKAQLRSLHRLVARGAPPGTIILGDGVIGQAGRIYVREGQLPAQPFRSTRRRGATDIALSATLLLLPGLHSGDNLVSFSHVQWPSCCFAAPKDGIGDLTLECAAGGDYTSSQAKACTYRRHDSLVPSAHGSFHSYESVLLPGYFLSTHNASLTSSGGGGRRGGGEGTAQLRPLRLAKRPADFVSGGNRPPSPFALSSAFEEAAPEAELPQNSWWLKSDGSYRAGGALLYPLNEVVDERYSVYWDLE